MFKNKHGMSRTPTYQSWKSMIQRCTDENHSDYPTYGNNGIWMSERWLNSFEAFLADMGGRPPGTSLERLYGGSGYCQLNCIWATPMQQARNKHTNTLLEFNGETKCIAAWAEVMGISPGVISHRKEDGWTDEEALTTPVGQRKKSA